ncbi:uncharacterized protein [Miscanthus floridulus]|uniref:uncharacterized protein n=1 Tax=Miscanthus floridulus TaxID=154761 RepID=UPI00345AE356
MEYANGSAGLFECQAMLMPPRGEGCIKGPQTKLQDNKAIKPFVHPRSRVDPIPRPTAAFVGLMPLVAGFKFRGRDGPTKPTTSSSVWPLSFHRSKRTALVTSLTHRSVACASRSGSSTVPTPLTVTHHTAGGLQSQVAPTIHGTHPARRHRRPESPPPTIHGTHPAMATELTAAQLRAYDGTDPSKPIYVSVRGKVYDVTSGRGFYGPGGAYAVFAGREASRALGKMSKDEADVSGDLSGLTDKELGVLADWETKFQAKYLVVARLADA